MSSTPFVVIRALTFEKQDDTGDTTVGDRGEVEIILTDDQPRDIVVKLAAGLTAGDLSRVIITKHAPSSGSSGTLDTEIFDKTDSTPANLVTGFGNTVYRTIGDTVPAGVGTIIEDLITPNTDFVTKSTVLGEMTVRMKQSINQTATYRIQIHGDGKH